MKPPKMRPVVDWRGWTASRCTDDDVKTLTRLALGSGRRGRRTGYGMTGDSIVIAFRAEDGRVELLDCLIRRKGVVRE